MRRPQLLTVQLPCTIVDQVLSPWTRRGINFNSPQLCVSSHSGASRLSDKKLHANTGLLKSLSRALTGDMHSEVLSKQSASTKLRSRIILMIRHAKLHNPFFLNFKSVGTSCLKFSTCFGCSNGFEQLSLLCKSFHTSH